MRANGSSKLIEEFRALATTHGACTESGDHKRGNRAHDALMRVVQKLRNEPDKGVSSLKLLMQDQDMSVRTWAASTLLPLDETAAVAVLEMMASSKGRPIIAFGAEMVLRELRGGRLKVD